MKTAKPATVKWYANRFDQFLIRLMFFAFVLSFVTSYGLLDGLNDSILVKWVSDAVPAVDRIASQAKYEFSARVTVVTQWLFAPIYWVALCLYRPPWRVARPADAATRDDLRRRAKGTVWGAAICIWIILADWKLVVGPSFLLGNVWEPTLTLGRLPFTGRLGLAVSSFLSPCFEAFIYWLVPGIISRQLIPSFLTVQSKSPIGDQRSGL